jgi:hypothetical protein
VYVSRLYLPDIRYLNDGAVHTTHHVSRFLLSPVLAFGITLSARTAFSPTIASCIFVVTSDMGGISSSVITSILSLMTNLLEF